MDPVFWTLMIVLIAGGVDGIKVLVSIPEGELTEAIKNATKQETKILEKELQSIKALLKQTSGLASKTGENPKLDPTPEPDLTPDSTPEAESEPEQGDVRLVNSDGYVVVSSGILEVFYEGEWGTVCDDSIMGHPGHTNNNMAVVVCRQLGRSGGTVHNQAAKGQGKGKIFLDNIRCTGTEFRLSECSHHGFGNHNCDHEEDVGVTCS